MKPNPPSPSAKPYAPCVPNGGVAQEALAHLADVERSHLGKVERGEHMPTLALILKIARALECSSAELMADTERRLEGIEP